MEPKRELSSLDLAAVVGELGPYAGATVDKAYRYGDDLLRFRLQHPEQGRVELLIEVGEHKRAHVADPSNVPDAPDRPPNFAKMLRNRIGGASLAGVEQHGFDRILECHFDRADGRTTVVAELFGEGNVAVVDATGHVIDCLHTVRLKSRTVAPGAPYEFPSAQLDPLDLSFEGFVHHMNDSDTDLVRTLATQLNFGGRYAEEVCARAAVEKERPISAAEAADYEALFEELRSLAEEVKHGNFEPRVYAEAERYVDVTPFRMSTYEALTDERFESFNAAVDEYFVGLRADRETDKTDVEERIARQRRIVEQQETAIERFEDEAEREREKAEQLYARYDLVDEVLSAIQSARTDGRGWDEIAERFEKGADRGIPAAAAVVDIDPAEGRVTIAVDGYTIELDPTTGVEQNADRLYHDAKEIEEKRSGAIDALEETREELARLEREGESEAQDAAAEPTDDWLDRRSIPVRKRDHWFERFRWFHTSDGFLVIGGRNAEQNEEVVKKYLDPGDRFFHAQAHGGPATVLKATGPNERSRDVDIPSASLEEAGQFAVTYSSVWKDGHYAGDVYMVDHDQVTKSPESGESLATGAFVIRGSRTYFDDTAIGCAIGIQCEPETRVLGGPPDPVRSQSATTITVEPGQYARSDVAKRIYRLFRERFTDTSFVRSITSTEEIAGFLPPGGSRIVNE